MTEEQPDPKKGLMHGKKGIVLGIANNRSIAWAIASALRREGAEIAITYQGDIFKKRVIPLAETLQSPIVENCDVTDDESVALLAQKLKNQWGSIDFIVHAIAYTEKENLKGSYLQTTKENFAKTLDISCFSLTKLCQELTPLMKNGGSIITLTYYGAERYVPNYNLMAVAKAALEASVRYLAVDLAEHNIRINSLSAGTVKTLAASGIGDFRYIMATNALNTPLKRNVTLEEIGNAGLYLLSDLSSGVTGSTHFVDCGFNISGMLKPSTLPQLEELVGYPLL
jgi:enoyl-[acyl-carrier protein] reductase I